MVNTDDMITLGGDGVKVDGEYGFAEKVSGSRRIPHRPYGLSPDAEDRMYYDAWKPQIQEPRQGQKWCPGILGRGCDWREREMFADDKTRGDGKDVICKDCRNFARRFRYYVQRVTAGGTVRIYKRRQE